jgi:hypothetical protein
MSPKFFIDHSPQFFPGSWKIMLFFESRKARGANVAGKKSVSISADAGAKG